MAGLDPCWTQGPCVAPCCSSNLQSEEKYDPEYNRIDYIVPASFSSLPPKEPWEPNVTEPNLSCVDFQVPDECCVERIKTGSVDETPGLCGAIQEKSLSFHEDKCILSTLVKTSALHKDFTLHFGSFDSVCSEGSSGNHMERCTMVLHRSGALALYKFEKRLSKGATPTKVWWVNEVQVDREGDAHLIVRDKSRGSSRGAFRNGDIGLSTDVKVHLLDHEPTSSRWCREIEKLKRIIRL